MTAAIFIRGILQHDHGVDFSKCTWVQGAINAKGAHGAPVVLPLLKPVKIEQGPPNKSLDDMLQEGVVDATIGTSMPESFRTNPNIGAAVPRLRRARARPLQAHQDLPDHASRRDQEVGLREVSVRRDQPFNAFQRAKEIALERMYNQRALRYMMPWLPRDIDEIHEYFGGDPWPYGVEENRPTLEALVQYLQDQHLTDWKPTLEELFVPNYGATTTERATRLNPETARTSTMSNLDALIKDLVIANRILAKEDVVDAYGHVSVRHPDNPKHFFLSRSLAPELIEHDDIVEFGLDGQPVTRREALALSRALHPRRRSWRRGRT